MPVSRPRPQRGDFPHGTQRYGQSYLGAPLLWFPAPLADSRSGLILPVLTAMKTPPSSPSPVRYEPSSQSCAVITWCWRSTLTAVSWGCGLTHAVST